MNKSNHLCLHIGLHKSASSFLQRKIFPDMFPEAPIDSKTGVLLPEKYKLVQNCNIDDDITIISHEGLSGRIKPAYKGDSYDRFMKTCECLNKTNREVRVLFVVRKHDEYLKSAFLHKYKKAFSRTFADYVDLHSENDLSWNKRIKELKRMGIPLLVIDFEDLKNEPINTIKLIADFWERDISAKTINLKLKSDKNKNPSPRSNKAITLLRYEYKIRRNFLKILNKVSLNKLNLRWRNSSTREWIVIIANSVFKENLGRHIVPELWKIKLDEDWRKTKKWIQRPK